MVSQAVCLRFTAKIMAFAIILVRLDAAAVWLDRGWDIDLLFWEYLSLFSRNYKMAGRTT